MPISVQRIISNAQVAIETAENIYADIYERKYKEPDYLMHLCLQAYSRCDEARGMLDTLTKEEYLKVMVRYGRLDDEVLHIKAQIREEINEITGLDI